MSCRVLNVHVRDNHNAEEVKRVFACDVCDYDTIIENNLNEHKRYKHLQNKETSKQDIDYVNGNEREVRIFWNHDFCRYEDRCTFLHEEIPACYVQDRCLKNQCPFYHFNKSKNNFLGRSQVRLIPQKK